MPIKKSWKVVGGTLAATVALGGSAALAQPGTEAPPIDLDDVVTIDEVTPATVASLFDDSPTITLDESVASPAETASVESAESASIETVSADSASVESASVESASVESASVESVSAESASVESASVESVSVESASADSAESADD